MTTFTKRLRFLQCWLLYSKESNKKQKLSDWKLLFFISFFKSSFFVYFCDDFIIFLLSLYSNKFSELFPFFLFHFLSIFVSSSFDLPEISNNFKDDLRLNIFTRIIDLEPQYGQSVFLPLSCLNILLFFHRWLFFTSLWDFSLYPNISALSIRGGGGGERERNEAILQWKIPS